jgi:hypothetical protein
MFGEDCISTSNRPSAESKELAQLLAGLPLIHSSCDVDLLLFLYRHPRTLLTNEQLTKFVGYSMKEVAAGLDAFANAGFLQRSAQPSSHAARMYFLVLDSQNGGDVQALLELASTREGRLRILNALNEGESMKPGAPSERAEVIELRRERSA